MRVCLYRMDVDCYLREEFSPVNGNENNNDWKWMGMRIELVIYEKNNIYSR